MVTCVWTTSTIQASTWRRRRNNVFAVRLELLLELLLLVAWQQHVAQSFVLSSSPSNRLVRTTSCSFSSFSTRHALHMNNNNNNNNNNKNFFQDMLDSAFANDPSLLRKQDKKDGSIDSALYSDDESENGYFTTAQENVIPTPTQQQWREAQAKLHQPGAPVQASSLFSNNNNNNNKKHIQWRLDLYLSGVPSKDPSNDLYGARTNISTRSQQQGMDLPDDPTVTVLLQLDHDGVCRVMNDTPFATPHQTDHVGEWKLSENGRMLRFRIFVLGYSRTVQTRGTIAAVAWSEREEVSSRTSTTYDIPPGWIYGDVAVGYGARPGTVHMPERGVLRVEQTVGLLQVASKMVPCGQFEAKQVLEDDDVV